MTFKTYDRGFRRLIAWQEAHKLTVFMYQVTTSFPKHEIYGLTSQLRRAASSTKAQIAEGSRMSTAAHRKSYYERAYASNAEVDSFIELAIDLEYIDTTTYESFLDHINRVGYLTHKLIQSCKA